MRLLQFKPKKDPDAHARLGALIAHGKAVLDLPATLDSAGRGGWLPPSLSCEWWNLDGSVWSLVRSSVDAANRADDKTVEQWKKHGKVYALEDARLCAPVPRPGKLICIGLNYRDHATESQMNVPESPIIFSKFSTCIVGPEDPVVLPRGSEKTDYEAELAVVIGKLCKDVPRDKALAHVFGYVCLNDISERGFQFADGQWQRGKSCDTFAPMGPYVVTADEVPNPHNLGIKLRLNGETMQNSRTEQLIFGVPQLIEFLSRSITLEPGDVIATGTPPGVGFARKPPVFIKPGDRMEVEIDGLGVLGNPVAAREPAA
jgi:2-keto-4-pentenoate hydratase/2-oxohepta-3-ene-1,7-dioic acid hydratase in catechol pathway